MSYIMIKIFLFDFLYFVKDKLDWKKKILKKNKIPNDRMIEVELATTEMYFSGILMHGYCMDLIQEWQQGEEGNASSIDSNNLPIPMKAMMFNHIGELEEALGARSIPKKGKKKKNTD